MSLTLNDEGAIEVLLDREEEAPGFLQSVITSRLELRAMYQKLCDRYAGRQPLDTLVFIQDRKAGITATRRMATHCMVDGAGEYHANCSRGTVGLRWVTTSGTVIP